MFVKSGAAQFGQCCVDTASFFSAVFHCALCVNPFALWASQRHKIFNEHIDQCFSNFHFPHREREKERWRERGEGHGGKSDEETKALEKL